MDDMSLEELRDYIRDMPDDEFLRVTIEFIEDGQEAGYNGQNYE